MDDRAELFGLEKYNQELVMGKHSQNFCPVNVLLCSRLTARITHTQPGLTSQGKHVRFVRLAFNHYGNSFIAGDQLGDIYLFNLTNNRCYHGYKDRNYSPLI